jgi:hypothetical protein
MDEQNGAALGAAETAMPTDINGRPFVAGWYPWDRTMRWWTGEEWGVTREEYEATHGENLRRQDEADRKWFAQASIQLNGAQLRPAPLPPLSATVAYLLMLFSLIGVCGVQHFYLGKAGRGLLWLFTFGLLGVGLLVDAFTLGQQTKTVNARRAVGIR